MCIQTGRCTCEGMTDMYCTPLWPWLPHLPRKAYRGHIKQESVLLRTWTHLVLLPLNIDCWSCYSRVVLQVQHSNYLVKYVVPMQLFSLCTLPAVLKLIMAMTSCKLVTSCKRNCQIWLLGNFGNFKARQNFPLYCILLTIQNKLWSTSPWELTGLLVQRVC